MLNKFTTASDIMLHDVFDLLFYETRCNNALLSIIIASDNPMLKHGTPLLNLLKINTLNATETTADRATLEDLLSTVSISSHSQKIKFI